MRFWLSFLLFFYFSLSCFSDGDDLEPNTGCYKCLNDWKKVSKTINYVTWPLYVFDELFFKISNLIDNIRSRTEVKRINRGKEELFKKYYCNFDKFDNCIENIKKLDKSLEKIVGQEEAIKIIRETMVSIIHKYYEFDYLKNKKNIEFKNGIEKIRKECSDKNISKKETNKRIENYKADFNFKNHKYTLNGPGCTFLYFAGPAGTGKTETANSLVSSISNEGKPAYTIDASTLLSQGGKFSTLFKDINIGSDKKRVMVRSDIDTYIRTSKRGIIIFNEVDKILEDASLAVDLNETLRTLKDNNYYIDSNGNQVDVSGIIFIFTSNEKINAKEDDPSGSMTTVHFNQSLRTRFRIVRFKEFVEEAYKILIKRYLKKVKDIFLEVYKDNKIKIDFEHNIENYCSNFIYNDPDLKSRGARSIDDVLADNLKSNLFSSIEYLKNDNNLNNKTFYISFDEKLKEFNVNTNGFISHVEIKPKESTAIKLKKLMWQIFKIILYLLLIVSVLFIFRIFSKRRY